MSTAVHVVALCGSRRDDSKTRIACRTALDAAADAGASTALLDRREYELPPLDTDVSDAGDAPALRTGVEEADAILLATPDYHGSYSGVLKNALDYLGRDEFAGKTVGLLEVAGGAFPTPAMAHLRAVCRTLNAWTLPLEVGISRSHETVADDRIADDAVLERGSRLGRHLVDYAGLDDDPDVVERPPAATPED